MSVLRYCRSCSGPRPRAAVRCPWCLREYSDKGSHPEHLFAQYQGEGRNRVHHAPPQDTAWKP